jgi:hypothetical protein
MNSCSGHLKRRFLLFLVLGLPAGIGCVSPGSGHGQRPSPAIPEVEVVRPPSGGIQPQAATDSRGTIHLLYFTGEAGGGDLHYTRREAGAAQWSAPLRINSRAGSAVAAGTIRGGQLALGKDDRVHVVWFGSSKSGIRGPEGSAPLLYTRLNDSRSAFESERNLMQVTTALDGGPGLAADREGNVTVAWQAGQRKGEGEATRRLWVARSTDDGATFSREVPAWDEPTGACPCCSTEAFADSKGRVYALYRMAANRSERDMVLVTSTDRGRTFRGKRLDPWPVDT